MKREWTEDGGGGEMNYAAWEQSVPETIRGDTLWRMEAYRLALFSAELAWHDVSKLVRDRRTTALSDQLYRAVGSIGANLAEGYSRGTGKDRARFYEYALGSARESRDWYYKGRHILGDAVVEHRLRLLTQVIRLLLTMVPQQRVPTTAPPQGRHVLSEDSLVYQLHDAGDSESDPAVAHEEAWHMLLEHIPLPDP